MDASYGLPRERWTRRPQRCGLTADERARAGTTPVPGPPVDVLFVPALEQAVHHQATILLVELRQGGEQWRHRVPAQRQRILRIEWPLGGGSIEIGFQDERIRVEQGQA